MKRQIVEPVGVLGVGVEGRATLDYLLKHGVFDITALDRAPIEGLPDGVASVFGPEHDQRLERFATLFRSPGIRPDHPSLEAARRAGTRITSAVSHFMERCPAPIIGVTGTVGKGTAATLISEVLAASGLTAHLGGNIGKSPLEFLDDVASDHRVVLEISSFQAMDAAASPHIGVILKTTSEHLDWHLSLDEYRRAKASLFRHQTPEDTLIANLDSEGSRAIAAESHAHRWDYSLRNPVERGIFLDGDRFIYRKDGDDEVLPLCRDRIRLTGGFNLENVAAGVLAALAGGAAVEPACRAAERFRGLPHRLELVAEAGGVRYYNDSYATRPEATIGAIQCFEAAPLALILGGSEKYADFGELAAAVSKHPSIVYIGLIGATGARLQAAIREAGPSPFTMASHADLASAVAAASRAVTAGGTVLLSPACASFGLFANYKVRGEQFRALVRSQASN